MRKPMGRWAPCGQPVPHLVLLLLLLLLLLLCRPARKNSSGLPQELLVLFLCPPSSPAAPATLHRGHAAHAAHAATPEPEWHGSSITAAQQGLLAGTFETGRVLADRPWRLGCWCCWCTVLGASYRPGTVTMNEKSVCCRAVQIRYGYGQEGRRAGRQGRRAARQEGRGRSRSKAFGRARLRGHPPPPLPRPSTANAPSPLRTGMREWRTLAGWLPAGWLAWLASLLLASLPGCSSSAWPSPLAVTVAVSAPPHADDSH